MAPSEALVAREQKGADIDGAKRRGDGSRVDGMHRHGRASHVAGHSGTEDVVMPKAASRRAPLRNAAEQHGK